MDKVVHFEIPADDIERAQKFYKELFGWNIQKAGDMPYWITHTVEVDENNMPKESGCINGGMLMRNEAEDPGSSNSVIVIDVSNTEEYCKKVEEAGGHVILTPRNVGDMGIYARIKDTEGNIVGLWQMLKKQG
jgi:uncharacterized protein